MNMMNIPISDCHVAVPKASSHAVGWKHLTEDGGGSYTRGHCATVTIPSLLQRRAFLRALEDRVQWGNIQLNSLLQGQWACDFFFSAG